MIRGRGTRMDQLLTTLMGTQPPWSWSRESVAESGTPTLTRTPTPTTGRCVKAVSRFTAGWSRNHWNRHQRGPRYVGDVGIETCRRELLSGRELRRPYNHGRTLNAASQWRYSDEQTTHLRSIDNHDDRRFLKNLDAGAVSSSFYSVAWHRLNLKLIGWE